ncbi:hypothetical protein Rcae01_03184 [Novipirellula caenicola]|uniref:Uncharacterized protein n=1 Tax=Novipirellula caenicola TaxID=1536901 RepID=A0ABP9VV96_9BACT
MWGKLSEVGLGPDQRAGGEFFSSNENTIATHWCVTMVYGNQKRQRGGSWRFISTRA